MRGALEQMRSRAMQDKLPLLSLLQAEPLLLQSSHLSFQESDPAHIRARYTHAHGHACTHTACAYLSFQEYFAARALCEGTRLSGTPPWQWPVWWANALQLGREMGDDFARGLLRAAGVEPGELNLCQTELE